MNGVEIKEFEIELENTKSGHERVSCWLNGKHYVGFLIDKKRKVEKRSVLGVYFESETYQWSKMRICNWEGCKICFPNAV